MKKLIINVASLIFALLAGSVSAATLNGTFLNITSQLPGGTNDPPDCFQDIQPGAPTYNNQIRYGAGTFSGSTPICNLTTSQQSGMGFQGSGDIDIVCPQAGTTEPISLGVFTHFNNPIAGTFTNDEDLLTGFDLNLAINDANNNINLDVSGFEFDETRNDTNAHPGGVCPYPTAAEVTADPSAWPDSDGDGVFDVNDPNPNSFNSNNQLCSDRVTLTNVDSTFVFDQGSGISCAMTVTGFAPCDNLSSDNVGSFTSKEGLSNEACIVAQLSGTTPVTLSHFSSTREGDKLLTDWGTSSELFNVGYQLWGLDGTDSKWEKLHGWLIRSGSGNAVEPQSYSKTVRIPASVNELVAVGISSVDSDGSEHYYGPFDVGQSYGNLSSLEPIAWDHIRDQVDAQMEARGYVKDRVHGYRKISGVTAASTASISDTQSVVEFKVGDAGVYRITAQALLNAGIDWADIAKRDIALIDHRGQAVVRYVTAKGSGAGQSKTLGAKGEIYFHAQGVDNKTGVYTESSVYRLVVDRYQALDAQYQGKRGISSGYSSHYQASHELEQDKQYSLTSAGDDPWLDTVVLSYPDQTGSYAAALPVEADAMWDHDAVLTLNLGRSSALTPVDNDGDGVQDVEHMLEAVVLSANGVGGLLPLGTAEAVGSGVWTSEFTIPGDTPLTLIDGKVVVGGVFRAGVGYAFSEVHVDSASLTYARPYVAKAGEKHLAFTAPEDGALGYDVTVPDSGWPLVFAHSNGNLVRMALESQVKLTTLSGETQRAVRFATLDGAGNSTTPVQYWVSGRGGLLSVKGLSEKTIVSTSSLLTEAVGAALLMVVHPAFMTQSLSDYAQFKRSQGLTVAMINYLDIVDAFGGGQPGPRGLTRYLSDVDAQGTLEHVLLVGGSSYDHTDKLDTKAMTFIPGHYGASHYSAYTVTDTPYIMDTNNQLFASIGRWPVRTEADLDTIIAHSVAWSTSDHTQGTALVIAEQTIAGEGVDFTSALDGVAAQLPAQWATNKVYVEEIIANDPSINLTQALAQAKGQIISGLEAGPDVVLYNGHGTISQLSNKGLFKAGEVADINGSGAQLWVPMSCYMTYYESTHVNTLAHQLLFSGHAVGITGAMLLSNQSENIATGTAVLNSTLEQGATIGEAVRAHKTSQNKPTLNINLNHLGDPTLVM